MAKYAMETMRFKLSGKYYDTIGFETDSEDMYQIKDEFMATFKEYTCMDYLITGYLYSEDDVPLKCTHPNGYPMLIKTWRFY